VNFMKQRKQRFREIIGEEIAQVCEERSNIQGYRKEIMKAVTEVIDKERMRLEYEYNAGSIISEIRDVVYNLGNYIGEN